MIAFEHTETTEFPSPIPCAMLSFQLLANGHYDGHNSFIYVDAASRPRDARQAQDWAWQQLAAFWETISDGWLDEVEAQISAARRRQRKQFHRD